MEEKKRQIAYKIWISNILNDKFVKQEGWDPNFIEVNGYKVARVNIIANVIGKYQADNYSSIVLDDGSSAIRVKAWGDDIKKLESVNIGDIILIIARPKEFNNERYLIPEVVKKIKDPNWELLRKIELLKEFGKLEINEIKHEEENPIILGAKQKILSIIEKHDKGEGVKMEDLVYISSMNEDDVLKTIKELLQWGEVYENKPNHVKVI